MKLQKYIFFLPAANELACKRLQCPKLRGSDIFTLYSIAYLPKASHSSLMRHARDVGYPTTDITLSVSLKRLLEADLVSLEARVYSLTWKAREYFSFIRRYMLHKRLS